MEVLLYRCTTWISRPEKSESLRAHALSAMSFHCEQVKSAGRIAPEASLFHLELCSRWPTASVSRKFFASVDFSSRGCFFVVQDGTRISKRIIFGWLIAQAPEEAGRPPRHWALGGSSPGGPACAWGCLTQGKAKKMVHQWYGGQWREERG